MQFSRWAPVPESMLIDLIKQLRKKKGLKEEIPKPTDFVEVY
jgi:elongation factor 2